MKTFALTLFIALITLVTPVFARIARFDVQVNPSTFKINETVDMTIRALDENGDVFKEYNGMVLMEFEEYLNLDMYDIPSDGVYTFKTEDIGSKTFSKGLKLKEGGTYTLNVFDINDETIMGSTKIIVGELQDVLGSGQEALASIISPLSGEKITSSSFALLGRSEVIRSPVQVFLNGNQATIETQTDAEGNFSAFLKGLNKGENKVFVRVVNIDNQVLAESEEIIFISEALASDGNFEGITITPSSTMEAGAKTTYTVQVGQGVSSAEIKIGDAGVFPLDKASNNSFSKIISLDKLGIQPISVNITTANGERKIYNNVEYIEVKEKPKPVVIQNLKVARTSIDSTQASLTWTNDGPTSGYIVMYGTTQDNLTMSGTTNSTSFTAANLEAGQSYFFQVFGANGTTTVGTPSSVVASNIQQGSAPVTNGSCTVSNVGSRTQKIGNQYFLIWDAVPGASSYTVSKTDANGAKQVVAEVTESRYQYPFDPTLETAKYETFRIDATCSDGQVLMVHGAAKVNVGPKENMIAIILGSLLLYLGYTRYQKRA